MKYNIFLILFFNFATKSCEYLYPIKSVCFFGEKKILVIYQKSMNDLELFLWDPLNKKAIKILSNIYTPIDLKILPDGNGFSFIDGQDLKVKFFNGRSPKTIDFLKSVNCINKIEWLDNKRFYCSAKKTDSFELFQGNLNAELVKLIGKKDQDFLYPSKIDKKLFYILRDKYLNHSIYAIDYPSKDYIINTNKANLVIDLLQMQISFLEMISVNEGFFLEYKSNCETKRFIKFNYYHLFKKNNKWNFAKIFEFMLPLKLFHLNKFLCLPKPINSKVYYPDLNGLFLYDLRLNVSQKIENKFMFSPVIFQDKIFFGSRIDDKLCKIAFKEDGWAIIELYYKILL